MKSAPPSLTDIAGLSEVRAEAARLAVEQAAQDLERQLTPSSAAGRAVSAALADAEAEVLARAHDFYRRLVRQPFEASLPSERAGPADAGPDVATAPPSRQGSALLARAQAYRGVPYRWGGRDPDGVDCSGLVVRAAADLGARLPHSAALLFGLGEPVPRENLLPGDLLFFSNTYQTGISHVGIYSGGSAFLAASSQAGKVTDADLDHPYFRARYAGARRLSLPAPAGREFTLWPPAAGMESPHEYAVGRALSAPFRLGS